MTSIEPTGIQLHLITGTKRMFYQENSELVAKICSDLDGNIFGRGTLIVGGAEDTSSFPGTAVVGITILRDPLPESFYKRERATKTIVTQISKETFHSKRLHDMYSIEGQRGVVLSEIEFVSGDVLHLEFSQIAESGSVQRNAMHHLFTLPVLRCRRLEGGFSVWNTTHIVSWTHYPKLEVPADSWEADSLAEATPGEARIVNFL